MPTLGFALVILGLFLFLVGLFGGPILPDSNIGGLWPLYSWTDSVPFYSGMGFVIVGTVLLNNARTVTAERGTVTPTRTGDLNLFRRMRLRHFSIDVGIALMAGVVGAAVNTFAAWDRSSGSTGFPLVVKSVNPGCFGPADPLGCIAYDPLGLALDAAFWAGLAFVIVAFTDLMTALLGPSINLRRLPQHEAIHEQEEERDR